ncbi:response regulator, partial [Myxococcota bacterium]|nr:response regulator [Myxococcota bacterium]
KAYVLDRDGYRCQSGRKVEHDKVLQVHHKVYRSQGGTDTPDNLVTICRKCHEDLHAGMFELKARKSKTKHATEMGIVKSQLKKRWRFEETYGYETKYKREQCLGLSKSHANDAVAICCEEGETVKLDEVLYLKRHVSAGDYQQTMGRHSQTRLPTGKLFGLRKHDLVRTETYTGWVLPSMSRRPPLGWPHEPPPSQHKERAALPPPSPIRGSPRLKNDDDALRLLTARYLEHHGIDVCACTNGLEAYRCFVDHGRFDLLLTDILMPEMDGLDLTRSVRQVRPALPVLFVSGFTPQPLRLEDFLSGPTIFLPKPYPLPQLLENLHRLWSLSLPTNTSCDVIRSPSHL